ncbi:helix-turn-helix domain-containing protein [Peribacillus kribbensis]|uniref:helix-turn-helix domain-containing protein n=1 Tax=Peribacillus kribbensis TaxID=356658 RepID=UPI0003FD1C75|nr:helix-turn-helix domain-containing protein [Peribacillus kribbensis]
MAKKGQTFQKYTEEFKLKAVDMYMNGEGSYDSLSAHLGLRSPTQLKNWVNKIEEGKKLSDQRGKLATGRLKTKFQSVEEERDYYKAQVEYLKKQYPNLHGQVNSEKQ